MYSLVFDLFTILREKQEDRDRDTLCPPAQIAHAANPELGISAVRTHTHTHTLDTRSTGGRKRIKTVPT